MDGHLSREEIREIVISSLPELLENDAHIRRFVLKITRDAYADREQTEGRIDRILDELKRDREAQSQKWKEEAKRWEEQREEESRKWDAQERKWEEQREEESRKWEEQSRKWDDQDRKWEEQREEQTGKWDAQERKWEEQKDEQSRKWDAQERKWEENQRVINELLLEVKSMKTKHESSIGALGARWGLYTEESFRSGLASILQKSFCVEVDRYLDYDYDGKVFGRPEQIEMDVIITNGQLILVEIKSSMGKGQLYDFWRKTLFYQEKHERKANRLIVIAPWVDENARIVAQELGIEIFSHAEDVK